METNEIMANEVMEVTEEAIVNNSKVITRSIGVAGTLLVGALAYKYLVKPAIRKYKESKNINVVDCADEDDFVETSDSEE